LTNKHFYFLRFIAQEEREYAIKSFKTGKKDVMVASGVASKGLDFSEIQHVINFTMPKEIEVRFVLSFAFALKSTSC